MLYLISQMLLLLTAAAALGAAVAWLVLRVRGNARVESVRQALTQRTHQLEQARTDVALLNEDFEELRLSSRDRIDALSSENREIPVLTSNLDKSQLLVRQMIQRHEAEIRELTAEKTVLGDRLRTLQERVRAREDVTGSGLLAPTDELSAGNASSNDGGTDPSPGSVAAQAAIAAAIGTPSNASSHPTTEAVARYASEAEPGTATGSATQAFSVETDRPQSNPRGWASLPVNDASNDSLDDVMEVGDDLAAELREDDTDLDADATLALELDASGLDASNLGNFDAGSLFEPVDRQDDLQQIFGIGPLTEKALNDLGITSYPQLAELERFEIEKIADALEIVPETIVRDDWVGNARKQLEEVLEEL